MKKYLFILRTAPHQGSKLQEFLDLLLMTAAFDQSVTLLLLDQGVFALKNYQQAEKHQHKETLSIFNALEIYAVHHIYVEWESLNDYGLNINELSIKVQAVQRDEVNHLMKQYQQLVSG